MLAYLAGNVGPSCGYVGLCLPHVGPSWGYGAPSWGYVGPSWGYVGPSWGYGAPSWGYVGPSWGPCWPMSGLCWPILSHKGRKSGKNGKSTKHRKTQGVFGGRGCLRQGAAAPLSYGEERNAYGYATARGPLAGFKRLRATAGQGPNYVGPSCGYMLAYVGLMLTHVEPKDPKNGNSKKRCKTQDILMVGGLLFLCWPILGAMWAHLGAMLAHLGAMLAHLGAMLAHLGAMLVHLGGYVRPS